MLMLKSQIRKDCPLIFSIKSCLDRRTRLIAEFGKQKIEFLIDSIFYTENASNLLESAYFFNPFSFYCDELQLSVECGYMDDSEGRKRLPHNVSFRWYSSLRCAEWFIELTEEEYYKKEPELHITIRREISSGRFIEYHFRVKYRDFCYAVGKCFTECMKRFGISGYHYLSRVDDINLRQLIFVKAYGLGALGSEKAFSECREEDFNPTFEEEIEILLADM